MGDLLRFFLVNIPEAVIMLMAGLAFFNRSIFEKWKQCALFGLIYSCIVFYMEKFDVEVKIPVIFLCMILLVHILLKEKLWMSLLISCGTFLLIIFSEFAMVMLLRPGWLGLPNTPDQQLDHFMSMWTYLLIAAVMIFVMRNYRFDVRNLIPATTLNRYLSLLLIAGCVEFVIVSLVTYRSFLAYQFPTDFPLSGANAMYLHVVLVFFALLMVLFVKYLGISKRHVQTETETPLVQNLDGMLTALQHMQEENNRGFQTLLAFLEADKLEEALRYTRKINAGQNTDIKTIMGVKNPAVASLLSAKAAICLAQHVRFTVDIRSRTQFQYMKSFEIIQLFGNLLDNAIRAAREAEDGRYVRLSWEEDEREEALTIENNGPTIPREKLEQIFELGYTTKQNEEGGVGLAIVKRVVNRYKGRIDVQSDDGVTVFRVAFNKR